MKKPNVLNRAMFNRGGTSAYGKGITSNLVSDEQRQRYNYGGRVGYVNRGLVAPLYPSGVTPLGGTFEEQEKYRVLEDPLNLKEEFKEWYTVPEDYTYDPGSVQFGVDPDLYTTPKKREDKIRRQEFIEEGPEQYEEQFKLWKEDKGKSLVEQEKEEAAIRAAVEGTTEEPEVKPTLGDGTGDIERKTDTASDVIDWTEFAEGLYDKKKNLGKALMQGAGTVFAASQLPKKEAAVLLGKGFGEFGKTISERREKIEDIAATGKMYEAVNVAKARETGKWALEAELYKAGLKGSDAATFMSGFNKAGGNPKGGLEAIVKKNVTATPKKKDKKTTDEAAVLEKGEGYVGEMENGDWIVVIEDGDVIKGNAITVGAGYNDWLKRQASKTQAAGS